jgi:tetratricopeptide (TPR) repeat protein
MPTRIGALQALSEMQLLRFHRIREPGALATAVETADEVLRLAEPDSEPALSVRSTLAEALHERYRVSSDEADLDRAIDVASDGARLSKGENQILCLAALGAALTDRALAAGSRGDADRAVKILTSAVDLIPPGSPYGERTRSRLGNALAMRARLAGDTRDIDAAITAYRKAIRGARDHHMLEGLASALIGRALWNGGLEDLNEAIGLCQEATQIAPEHDRYRAQSLLTTALGRRAVRTGGQEDRDAAIEAGTAALLAMPSRHPERRVCLSNLASVYLEHHRKQREILPDLNKAIDLGREALQITPPGNGHRPSLLANLASALTDRFAVTSQVPDFHAAAEYANMAIAECPADRAEHAQLHYLRARVFLGAAKRLANIASPQQLAGAVQDLRTASGAPLASPAIRVVALAELAELATDPDASLAYYEEIIPLTPLLVSPRLSHSEREGLLAELKGVFREAVATALDAGQRERAVELLEYGRSIDWSQTARPDLDLRPAPYSRLRPAAAEGAIVLINIAKRRSDAMALTPDGLHVIPLTSATPAEVEEHVAEYIDGLANMETGGPELVFGEEWAEEMRTTLRLASRGEHLKGATLIAKRPLEWLWKAIAEPVLTALGHIGTPADVSGASWPRVWWCPAGLLAHLPLHAAGRHIPAVPGESVIDRVVSSYTPSLMALIEARDRPASDANRMLVVAMRETPGLPALPDADDDISVLTELFGGRTTAMTGAEATREAVCAELPGHSWAHFACHGVFEPLNPTLSGLRLHDETLTVDDILKLRLENAEFAFLSSCNSAVSGYRLPDDGMSVSAALHAAGFRHVVAASWIVLGRYAGFVSDHVYRAVNADVDTTRPQFAVALHQALRELRAQPDMELGIWMPFTHIGP